METTNALIHKLSFDHKHRVRLFLELAAKKRAHILLHLTKRIQKKLAHQIPHQDLIETLEHLDPDDATDIIQLLPKRKQTRTIKSLSSELKKNIEFLSQFDPKTAAGLMNLNYIQVDIDDKIADIAKQFQTHEKRTGHLPVIIAMSENIIVGHIPGHQLGLAKPSEKAKKHVKKILTIKQNASQIKILDYFRKHPHSKIAVLGEHENIIGIIYSDDILKILREQEAAALYDFAGVLDEETVTDTISQKVKHRYKWLIVNLFTAFIASFTVSLFDNTISKHVLLAVYMPIVAGMGGNAATQTLAILVRGIALNQIELSTAWPTLKRETLAAVVNGLINGLLVAAIVMIFNQDVKIALVLALAMITNLFVAGFFGTLVPLIMKNFGKDPATSATIFITTATDVLGFLSFLGLATLVLN